MENAFAPSAFHASSAVDASAAPAQAIDLNALFRKHHQHLLRFVQRYVRNLDDAKDVVQNTFLEAARCQSRFCGLSKPSTWLFGIAHNLARNQVRRNYADRCDTFDESFVDQIIDEHADPMALMEQRQIAAKVETLLSNLNGAIRSTFEAVFDGEATYEQAAEQLQIPVGTVRSRVSRVRAAVRKMAASEMGFDRHHNSQSALDQLFPCRGSRAAQPAARSDARHATC